MVFKVRVSSPVGKWGGLLVAVWAFLLPSGVFISPKLAMISWIQGILSGMQRKLLRREKMADKRRRQSRTISKVKSESSLSPSSSSELRGGGYWFEGLASNQRITSASTNSDDQEAQKYEGPTVYQEEHELSLPYPSICDTTEGIAAFENLYKLGVFRDCNGIVLNLGGGAFNHGPSWLEERVPAVKVLTADPFRRSYEHNRSVQAAIEGSTNGAEIVLSISVLNVVKEAENRLAHLRLAHRVLKSDGGILYAKVWAGMWPKRGTGRPEEDPSRNSYQGNRWAADYLSEVQAVFGYDNCFVDCENSMVVAVKR